MSSEPHDYALWIIGRRRHLDVSQIWSHFHYACIPDQTLVSFRSPDITRNSIKASQIEQILDGALIQSLEILGVDFRFSYGQSGGQNYDRIFVESSSFVLAPELCDELISETLANDPNFTQAHLVDANYQHLQNIFDPLQFKALGLSMDGLPMKSNGLPFPLEQKIVDTDLNPGRYRLRQGYVEASAGYMWFGESFWSIIGTTPENVQEALPEEVSFHLDKCWKLAVANGVFCNLKTSALQNKIRRALFGEV